MAVNLHTKRVGEGPCVVLLHGLFGTGGNLGALARSLQESYLVFSPDLPSHGRSAWLEFPDVPAMADNLDHWMQAQGLGSAHFVGHSLGGKVAMQLALKHPDRVASLAVADIAPVAYPNHHEAVFAALDAVAAAQCQHREDAVAIMDDYLNDESVILFLLVSLRRNRQGIYQWLFDLDGLKRAYSAILAAPANEHVYDGPVLFIKGGDSNYILEEHRSAIEALFPQATLKVMPGCEHWLHVQNPAAFNGIVGRFLQQQCAC